MAEPPPVPPPFDPNRRPPSVHASCVAVGGRGVLIRGASGAGKSTLALRLILDAPRALPPAELVADDRVWLEPGAGALWAAPVPELAGLVEVRGLGIRRLAFRERVPLALVVDLGAPDGTRLPQEQAQTVRICDLDLPRLVPDRLEAAALLVAAFFLSEPCAI